MRCLLVVALALSAAAQVSQVHKPAVIPRGWTASAGSVPKDEPVKVTIGMTRSNRDHMAKLLHKVSDPQGKAYLQYPSYEEIGDMVRPKAENMQMVREWLAKYGATVEKVHPHGDYIHAIATIRQVEAMANGEFKVYEHATQGKIYRLTSGVFVDSHIAAVIDTFSGFHGFPLAYQPVKMTGADVTGVTPQLLRSTYKVSPVASSGKKNIQAIAQFQGQYVVESSLQKFCTEFNNGTTCKITKFIGRNLPIAGIESMLDSEWILSIGNRTETWAYSYPNVDFCSDLTTFGSDVTGESEHPFTISISYGTQFIDQCETSLMTRFAEDVEKMGTLGITVMISSGDDGSGGETRAGSNNGKLSPSFPASVPACIAVGGTYFVSGTSGEEEATTQFGSGGGFSYDFPVPPYQQADITKYLSVVAKPKSSYATGRGSPDVSALAENFNIISSGRVEQVGGTSASSPSFTGMMTLLNEECLRLSGKTLGYVNPMFYANPSMFTDVTKGTNAIGENAGDGWAATAGWDAATGLGTPNFAAMLAQVRSTCQSVAARHN
ncbi:Tripeptidyl-peptidase sed1 [Diplonema papillatum]|nr:Tripeptidyl-peptidase sed1 [Diplonema papillatum]